MLASKSSTKSAMCLAKLNAELDKVEQSASTHGGRRRRVWRRKSVKSLLFADRVHQAQSHGDLTAPRLSPDTRTQPTPNRRCVDRRKSMPALNGIGQWARTLPPPLNA
jgi:hypothetical protein